MYDLERIKQNLSCVEAAENLGLKMRRRGKAYDMLCPAHNDHNFGSCFCYDTKWKCFACGAGGDVFALIRAVKNVSTSESFAIAAKMTGTEEKYQLDKDKQKQIIERKSNFPLNDEELALLDVKKNFSADIITNISYESENYLQRVYNDDGNYMYALIGNRVNDSIYTLFEEDPEGVTYVLSMKAVNIIDELTLLENCNMAVLPISAEEIYELKTYLKIQKIKLKNILQKLDKYILENFNLEDTSSQKSA